MSDGYRTKQAELAGDGFRIIRVADVKEGRVALDGPDFVSADFQKQIGLKQAAVGDVLLTTKGTVGRVAVVPDGIGRAVYSPQLCWFRIADARILQPRYLSYWLQSGEFLSQSSHMQGNTDMAPYISLSDLRRTKIALRPHREQVSIAEVLGALDDKIAANISLSMTIASHLEADHARLTSNTRRMVSLADLVSTQYGVTTSATQGFDGPRLLRVTDINKHPWVDWETTPCCDITTAEQERYQLHSGDIVVARMADPGKAGWIETGDPTAVFASYLVRLRAKIGHHAPFIYQFLRSAEYAMYADGAMQGSVQRNMNAKVIVGTEIRLPAEEVLHLFAERFLKARAAMAYALRENRTLAATRDALLPQLMSGKLRVRDAEAIVADAGA